MNSIKEKAESCAKRIFDTKFKTLLSDDFKQDITPLEEAMHVLLVLAYIDGFREALEESNEVVQEIFSKGEN